MKKLVAVLAAAVLAGGSIFAGDFYNGDVQLQFGVGIDSITVQDADQKIGATLFDMGIESWHLFRPIELIGVGFSVGGNFGVGPTDKWNYRLLGTTVQGSQNGVSLNCNFDIGPAVAIYLGKVVRFGLNFGFNAGLSFDQPFVYEYKSRYSSGTGSVSVFGTFSGIDLGLQAKFLPDSVVNPVVGWRFVSGSANSYTYEVSSFGSGSSSAGTVNRKYEFIQNVLYAALSFSW